MKKILLVEDNTDIRENVTEMLELAEYTVITAENGKIGFELAKSATPDLILSDIKMPVMNGYEFFEALKKNDTTKNIPFVFMTSSVEEKDVLAALKNGADGYVRKPFDENDLFNVLRKYFK
jgi:CheY-like chemotaxis protein